jgi:pimeloyl-ACP methyl ester carboxylesterase
MRLRDGRALAYAEFGDPDGVPLFFFHGAGNTRLTRHPDDTIVEQLGVRLITVDRPGVGLSDAHPGRTLMDWAGDVAQLADCLCVDTFSVLGWSAGGPFSLACAHCIPGRIQAAGVMSGLPPLCWSDVFGAVSGLHGRIATFAGRFTDGRPGLGHTAISTTGTTPPPEVRAANRHRFLDLLQGRDWHRVSELAMLARSWGFHLQDIEPVVHFWHGAEDRTIPLSMTHRMCRAVPRAVLTVFPGEGHHAGFTHWREVVQAVTA